MREFLNNIWADKKAISSVEYALLLAFIASGIIVAAELLSNAVENELRDTAKCIEGTLDPTDLECGGPEKDDS